MVAQVCACRHLDERIGVFNQIGIPAAVAKASFDGFKSWSPDHARAKTAAEDFARKFRKDAPTKGYLLYGRPGAGKTHLLVATLRYLALEKGVAGRYVEFMLLLSDIRAGFDAKQQPHGDPCARSSRCRCSPSTSSARSAAPSGSARCSTSSSAAASTPGSPRSSRRTTSSRRARPAEEPGRVVRTRSPEFQRDAEAMTLAQRVGDRIYSRLNEMCTFVKLDPGHDLRKDRHGSGSGGFWGA